MDTLVGKIHCMTATEGLSKIKDDSIDLICIDPPYDIKYCSWDSTPDWHTYYREFFRILKHTGNLIIFQGWSGAPGTISARYNNQGDPLFELQNWIIWDRVKGRGARRNFTSTREDILWFTFRKAKDYTFNKIDSNIPKKTKGMGTKNGRPNRALSNVWTDISPIVPWSKERVDHPTQKPVALIERIVTIFSNEGDLVLDCFSGSGTTAVACKNLNRRFICFDDDERYCALARRRLNESI